MKKPGGQENEPTTVQKKPSSKEADPSLGEDQKEEAQKEDVGEEEQEEENKEEDPEVEVHSTKLPVTLKNMKTHEDLLAGNQLIAAFKLLPAGEQQKVWKKFESSRKKPGNDASYQEHTKGHGRQSKKKDKLRGWLGQVLEALSKCHDHCEPCPDQAEADND